MTMKKINKKELEMIYFIYCFCVIRKVEFDGLDFPSLQIEI